MQKLVSVALILTLAMSAALAQDKKKDAPKPVASSVAAAPKEPAASAEEQAKLKDLLNQYRMNALEQENLALKADKAKTAGETLVKSITDFLNALTEANPGFEAQIGKDGGVKFVKKEEKKKE